VVAAALTPSKRDLVVWGRVPAHEGDRHSFAFFSAHVGPAAGRGGRGAVR